MKLVDIVRKDMHEQLTNKQWEKHIEIEEN
jgi:hypothetical protein